jgi:hypothetical protein
VGLTRLKGVRVTVDADELSLRSCFEERSCMACATERGVDDDSPALQCRNKELDDSVSEDGLVSRLLGMLHAGTISPPSDLERE